MHSNSVRRQNFPARKPYSGKAERKRGRSSFRAGGERREELANPDHGLASRDHGRVAHGLQRGDGLGHKRRLLFDDGVIDGSAEAFVEDFDAVEFGGGGGAIFVGGGDGDVKGQDLISEPGESGLTRSFSRGASTAFCSLDKLTPSVYTYIS